MGSTPLPVATKRKECRRVRSLDDISTPTGNLGTIFTPSDNFKFISTPSGDFGDREASREYCKENGHALAMSKRKYQSFVMELMIILIEKHNSSRRS
ncbi:hypothetical protein E3N88_45881 [Mikania micrantha]|uniref:C-type lectin domain-containing protein n=1 Tax=Mikania micrantha TaxID=192012 RepID=A0A5N6L804_9ASTR|nr:hypothetical protein E3N88_45881 [Mikania micrantha]